MMPRRGSHTFQYQNSPIILTPYSHSTNPGGFASYHVQQIIKYLKCCTQRGFQGTVLFQPPEVFHSLEAVGGIMHQTVNLTRYQGNVKPSDLPPNIRGDITNRGTCCQWTPHSKAKHGSIPPLCGGIFVAVGTPYPRLNTLGSL